MNHWSVQKLRQNHQNGICWQFWVVTYPVKSYPVFEQLGPARNLGQIHLWPGVRLYLRNRKRFPCSFKVMVTRGEVWQNERSCGNTSSRRRVCSHLCRVFPNYHECYNNFKGTWKVFSFVYKINARKFVMFPQNCGKMAFNRSIHVLHLVFFLVLDRKCPETTRIDYKKSPLCHCCSVIFVEFSYKKLIFLFKLTVFRV